MLVVESRWCIWVFTVKMSTFIMWTFSSGNVGFRTQEPRLQVNLYNNRTIGCSSSFLFTSLYMSWQPPSLCCRVAFSMGRRPDYQDLPKIYISHIQYQTETGQIFFLLPSPNIQEKRLTDPPWVRHPFLDQSIVARRTGWYERMVDV